MGIIQSAVNQALGTVGTVAGIGKIAKTGQESLELQKKAQQRLDEEQAYKKLKTEKAEQAATELLKPLEQAAGTTEEGIQKISPALSKNYVYTAEQLEKHYLDLGDYKKAAQMKERQVFFSDLYAKQEQAREQALQKQQAKKLQHERFVQEFTEGGRYR